VNPTEPLMALLGAAVVEAEYEPDGAVDDDDLLTLPAVEPQEYYLNVLINLALEPQQIYDVKKLLSDYHYIFSDVPCLRNLAEHKIELTTEVPVRSNPYLLPYAMRAVVNEELDCMLKLGVIEPCNTFYASPLVVIKKSDQTNRMCCDFRKLNFITVLY